MHTGQRITLPLAGQRLPFTVAGIWRDYARQFGAIVIDASDYRRLTRDTRVSDAALSAATSIWRMLRCTGSSGAKRSIARSLCPLITVSRLLKS